MMHSIWTKILSVIALSLLSCSTSWAMPASGTAIHVPKPGAIGSHLPHPTVPIGNYQHPGKIPIPMTRPVASPMAPRPIPTPKLRTPATLSQTRQMMPAEIGLTRQAQLFVYHPALHLYTWQQSGMLTGLTGFQALANNPQLSAAWWKPLPLWNQGDMMNAILPRLTEETH